MLYPSMAEVESANVVELCSWSRFLPSPGMYSIGRNDFEEILERECAIMKRIIERREEAGGFTPEISKRIGW